jgi:hypothetical protein
LKVYILSVEDTKEKIMSINRKRTRGDTSVIGALDKEEKELLTYFRGMRQESRNTMLATAHTVCAVEEGIRKQYGLPPESSPAPRGEREGGIVA